jgi:hypothetical protein
MPGLAYALPTAVEMVVHYLALEFRHDILKSNLTSRIAE